MTEIADNQLNPSMNGFNEDYDDDRIKSIIASYKKKHDREKKNYQEYKDDEDFKMKNREKSKKHYADNKQLKKDKYQKNKEFLRARSLYNYYKYNEKLDVFKTKHTAKCELLANHGIIVE